jgi:hypothetical protein
VNERLREPAFAGAIALMLAVGVLVDVATGGVSAPARQLPGPGALSARAVFCPPTSGEQATARASVVATGRETVMVDTGAETRDLNPDRSLGVNRDSNEPLEILGYGRPVVAGVAVSTGGSAEGAGALLCSGVASPQWYFAAGSASLASDERILLYNPFPDEAVVRVNFFTPEGRELRTTFEEVPVPARSWESVEINEAIRVTTAVAVAVNASRGRVVAWRELFAKPEQLPSGLQATVGAPASAPEWYFPDGAIGPGADERIALFNPTGRQAEVAITLSTTQETIQGRRLMEIAVPRRSTLQVSLEEKLRLPAELTGVSATVISLNGVDIVAERTVWYSTGEVRGVASEVGARRPALRWALPPAAVSPTTDAVTVMNPGAEPVTVAIEFLRTNDAPIAPGDLQEIHLRPGSRVKLPVGEYTAGRSVPALVTASGPVIAERFSYSNQDSDAGSLIGIPLRQWP